MFRLSSYILLTLFLLSCKENGTENTNTNLNLILNSSFETSSNKPDYSHWTGNAFVYDSNFNKLDPIVEDAPTGGGKWCVQVEPLWFPEEGHTETGITGEKGENIYELSGWFKTINWHATIC